MASTDHRVFAVAQRSESESVSPSDLYTIGTIATIGSVQRGLGGIRLVLEGKARGIALRLAPTKQGYLEATVQEAQRDAAPRPARRRVRRPPPRGARARGGARQEARSPRRGRRADPRRGRRARPAGGPRRRLPRRARRRQAGPSRDALGRRPAAARPRPRPAPDRRPLGAGGHPVQGQGGDRQPPARDVPARADEGDPEGARRGRRGVRRGAEGAARQARRARSSRGRAQGGRPRVAAPDAHRPRVDGVAGHPHLPRDGRGAAVERPERREARRARGRARSSTRTTTA